jgi:hypothetical protein
MVPRLLQVVGLAAITAGAALVFPPAGLIVGGVAMVLVGISEARDA